MNYTQAMTQLGNLTTFGDMLKFGNTASDGTFWTGMYWLIIIVSLITATAFGVEIALMLSFFLGLVLGLFLLYAELIGWQIFAMTEAILIFLVLYFIYTSNKNN